MEEFTPRRRDVGPSTAFSALQRFRVSLTLPEIVLIFSSATHQTAFPVINDPVSMSIRALALTELAIRGAVAVSQQGELVAADGYAAVDSVHDEIYQKIKNASKRRPVEKWLRLLNGESFSIGKDKYHVKNARKRTARGLVSKNVLKAPKSQQPDLLKFFIKKTVFSTDTGSLKGCRSEITQELARFLLEGLPYAEDDQLRLSACICSLAFCGLVDDVLLTLPPSAADRAQKKVAGLVARFKTSMGNNANPKEWSVFCILREYLKLGNWV